MNRGNILTALEEVERAFTEQSALCRNRGTDRDTQTGVVLHAMANSLFTARTRLKQKWKRKWFRIWPLI